MNKLNFLISSFLYPDFVQPYSEDVLFSLIIEKPEDVKCIQLEVLHTAAVYLAEHSWLSLYLNLEVDARFNVELADALIKEKDHIMQLIFHPRFKRTGNKPTLFISINKQDVAAVPFINRLESYAMLQGFEGIHWVYFRNTKTDLKWNFIYKFKESQDFQTLYYNLLEKDFFAANYIGILNASGLPCKDILTIKCSTEELFKENFPDNSHLLYKYVLLDEEVVALREKLSVVLSNMENQKIYLHLMREEDEANKINNFYYTEYEILPLWYKKIGHILKVIMGKRSFRSLFDNNVKKYKE